MEPQGIPFPWWWNGGTISTVLDVIWGMSVKGAMNFRLDQVIDRHQEKHGTSADEVRVLERELKRFVVLVSLHPDRSYGIKGPVDTHQCKIYLRPYRRYPSSQL